MEESGNSLRYDLEIERIAPNQVIEIEKKHIISFNHYFFDQYLMNLLDTSNAYFHIKLKGISAFLDFNKLITLK